MTVPTFNIDIVSAEAEIFSGKVARAIVTGSLGELGIMPGHAPLLTGIVPGQVQLVLENGDVEFFYISGGILEVQPNITTLLTDTAVRATDIDEASALAAREKAKQMLSDQEADFDYTLTLKELASTAAQLRVIQQLRKHRKR